MSDPGGQPDRPVLPSGLAAFDTNIGGGYPAGSLIAISAPPESPAELFCEAAVSEASRESVYLSTARPAAAITATLSGSESVLDVESNDGEVSIFPASPIGSLGGLGDVPPAAPTELVCLPDLTQREPPEGRDASDLSDGVPAPDGEGPAASAIRAAFAASQPTVVVDAFSDFLHDAEGMPPAGEEPPGWLRLLRWLRLTVSVTDGLGIVLLQSGQEQPYSVAERLVLRVADGHIQYVPGNETDQLRLTKLRGFDIANADIDSLPLALNLNIGETIAADPDQKV
jgi:hypothetical protein